MDRVGKYSGILSPGSNRIYLAISANDLEEDMRKKTQRQLVEVVAESFSLANRRIVEESPHFYALVGLGSAARAYRQNAKIGRPLLLEALKKLDEVQTPTDGTVIE